MGADTVTEPNIRQAVPFFAVSDMTVSLAWYLDGLGAGLTHSWAPDGRIRWCWLSLGAAALMLQEYTTTEAGRRPMLEHPGRGVTVSFQCADALAIYRECCERGLTPGRPFVGNQMWVFHLIDPDGYRLEFESPTDVLEGTTYSGE